LIRVVLARSRMLPRSTPSGGTYPARSKKLCNRVTADARSLPLTIPSIGDNRFITDCVSVFNSSSTRALVTVAL